MHVNDNVKITVVWVTDQIFFNCRSSHNNEEKKNEVLCGNKRLI